MVTEQEEEEEEFPAGPGLLETMTEKLSSLLKTLKTQSTPVLASVSVGSVGAVYVGGMVARLW